jgi:hypothetical protein
MSRRTRSLDRQALIYAAVNASIAFVVSRWIIGQTLAFGLWAAILFGTAAYTGTKARLRGGSMLRPRRHLRVVRDERERPDDLPPAA